MTQRKDVRSADSGIEVLVLGCGPAGLLAAHAVRRRGNDRVLIVSKARPSRLYGCQYLHERIPDLNCGAERTVDYQLRGTAQGYAEKVYGGPVSFQVSPEQYQGQHSAWDLRTAYGHLWQAWQHSVMDYQIESAAQVEALINDLKPHTVFSTIPAGFLCSKPDTHFFNAEMAWAVGDAPEQGVCAPFRPPEETVICNGEEAPRWYRAARVFGYTTVEWPFHPRPPQSGLARVVKPLGTNCNCLPGVVRLGRYGAWRKGYLVHHAYDEAYARLASVQERLF